MAARAALPQKPAAASWKKDGRTLVDLRSVRDERPPSGFPLAGSATGGMRAGEGGDFRGTFRASLSRDLRHLETGSHSRSFVSGTAIPLSSPFLLTGPTADTREESIVFHTRWLPGCLHCDRRKLPPLPPFPLLPTVLFDVCRLLNVIEGVPTFAAFAFVTVSPRGWRVVWSEILEGVEMWQARARSLTLARNVGGHRAPHTCVYSIRLSLLLVYGETAAGRGKLGNEEKQVPFNVSALKITRLVGFL